MMRVVRFLIGLALLPLCAAVVMTAFSLACAAQTGSSSLAPPAALAFGGGFLFWLFLFFTVPRPVRAYVLAHELTHALWGLVMGARVSRMRVSRESGSVTLSKTNILITLAPYFFPLYAALILLLYFALSFFFEVQAYDLLWLVFLGFAWSFHVTFTISSMMHHQTDIRDCGYLFSWVLIFLLNVLQTGLWIVAVSDATLAQMGRFLLADTLRAYSALAAGCAMLWNGARKALPLRTQ